jgi:hypothetical protein
VYEEANRQLVARLRLGARRDGYHKRRYKRIGARTNAMANRSTSIPRRSPSRDHRSRRAPHSGIGLGHNGYVASIRDGL